MFLAGDLPVCYANAANQSAGATSEDRQTCHEVGLIPGRVSFFHPPPRGCAHEGTRIIEARPDAAVVKRNGLEKELSIPVGVLIMKKC